MFPGYTTKLSEKQIASAATIVADADVLFVTGATQIDNITPKTGGFSQIIWLIPVDGAITLGNGGNIQVGDVIAQNRATFLIFSKLKGFWYAQDPL